MTVAVAKTMAPPPEREERALVFIDPELVVTPDGNPVYTPADLADLADSFRQHDQLVPGFICPSPELRPEQRLCLEGNRRLAVARMLGRTFWAFDHGRFVPEEERIRLLFHHNGIRRRMSREEIAERAARWLEITGATQAEAAKVLGCSGPTLSRAFGEKRIPQPLKAKAELLGLSIRALIAATPAELMPQAVEFALAARDDGRKPSRDQVAGFIQQLKKQASGPAKGPKARTITLRINGRAVILAVDARRDSAASVAEDLKAIVARLGKHTDVPPDGWPFLFQQ